ncbi:MAG: OpgC domain-containing protein, partial [Hyphomicrobiaceae bacterium]|nr:OpgC domain-containing protein [Hyphomicrobiaceae bacterium]
MSTASSASAVGPAEPHVVPTRLRRPRDVRLDFFRGLGMFIIFVSHVPHNIWANVIPARFGFSDATEIFVFCSGMASALAFGRMFDESGLIPGLSRIAHRCWQVYWAHIGVFLVSASLLIGADYLLATGGHYLSTSSIAPFFGPDTPMYLVGLLTLSYVPGLFNILPMYLVILALIPFVVWLGRYGRLPVAAFVLSLYAVGTSGIIDFGGDPLAPEVWFF